MLQLERETLNDRAYDALKHGLISGQFVPGQALVIRKLAETLGISTTPIREALQRLVAERILELQQNRSVAVPRLTSSTFCELTRIRSALEGMAVELATADVRPTDLERLHEGLDGMDRAIAATNGAEYLKLNEAFHFAVYRMARAPILLNLIEDLWGRVGPYMNLLMDSASYVPQSNDHHRALVAALAARDPGDARRALTNDIAVAAAALIPRLTLVTG
ncbi:GntR family transcriptional regulator [Lichenifustis flavocetrariae]|uniref:GntR family transcriptional regulator n=1 Tax=Lichenifustis flavocetrariae TaxID=2949735 RepID=A0AA41Z7M7_9HYPH|nr:GntR family transcriptional regulator [Lichenifustis flavocetrariae]MCW6511978.1 GntR family transcriptional regulator [Lichenifustis flavocetrariae]